MIYEFHFDLELDGRHLEELDVAIEVRRTSWDDAAISRVFVLDWLPGPGRVRTMIDVTAYSALAGAIVRKAATEELGWIAHDLGCLGRLASLALEERQVVEQLSAARTNGPRVEPLRAAA